jgi:hypothetical protein
MSSYNNYGLQGRATGLKVVYDVEENESFEPIEIDFQKIKVQSEVIVKFKME